MTDDTTTTPNPELEQLQAELAAMTETAQRALADFANFKRRTEEERKDLHVYANLKFLQSIFPALDNFKRAFETVPPELQDHTWVKGIESIETSLFSTLQNLGLEVIDAIGVPVDPHQHEVLMEAEGPVGQVIQIFEKGYKFNGVVVRPAKVMVGKN
jgi:molecular chaperone GrpE